jgi:hypothetical protein
MSKESQSQAEKFDAAKKAGKQGKTLSGNELTNHHAKSKRNHNILGLPE